MVDLPSVTAAAIPEIRAHNRPAPRVDAERFVDSHRPGFLPNRLDHFRAEWLTGCIRVGVALHRKSFVVCYCSSEKPFALVRKLKPGLPRIQYKAQPEPIVLLQLITSRAAPFFNAGDCGIRFRSFPELCVRFTPNRHFPGLVLPPRIELGPAI